MIPPPKTRHHVAYAGRSRHRDRASHIAAMARCRRGTEHRDARRSGQRAVYHVRRKAGGRCFCRLAQCRDHGRPLGIARLRSVCGRKNGQAAMSAALDPGIRRAGPVLKSAGASPKAFAARATRSKPRRHRSTGPSRHSRQTRSSTSSARKTSPHKRWHNASVPPSNARSNCSTTFRIYG
jgi:hypothetical protein